MITIIVLCDILSTRSVRRASAISYRGGGKNKCRRASTLLRLAREDTWLPLGINPLQWRQRPGTNNNNHNNNNNNTNNDNKTK